MPDYDACALLSFRPTTFNKYHFVFSFSIIVAGGGRGQKGKEGSESRGQETERGKGGLALGPWVDTIHSKFCLVGTTYHDSLTDSILGLI